MDQDRPVPPSASQHLDRQLRFLESSAQGLDSGHVDEAIRIATAIRVILHQTTSSTSLLTQLSAPHVPLLRTTRGFFEDGPGEKPWVGATSFHYDGAGFLRQTGEGLLYRPKLGDGSYRGFLPAPDWWRQVIFALDPTTIFTRRAIVLGAANQDGGAHVIRTRPNAIFGSHTSRISACWSVSRRRARFVFPYSGITSWLCDRWPMSCLTARCF